MTEENIARWQRLAIVCEEGGIPNVAARFRALVAAARGQTKPVKPARARKVRKKAA